MVVALVVEKVASVKSEKDYLCQPCHTPNLRENMRILSGTDDTAMHCEYMIE